MELDDEVVDIDSLEDDVLEVVDCFNYELFPNAAYVASTVKNAMVNLNSAISCRLWESMFTSKRYFSQVLDRVKGYFLVVISGFNYDFNVFQISISDCTERLTELQVPVSCSDQVKLNKQEISRSVCTLR